MNEAQGTSTRPYLLRALHDWCTDNGFTPYLAVFVGPGVQVPMEYVKNNEIVLNIGFEATSGLLLGNDFVEFKARFGGMAREIKVPIDHVVAIYARENGQGMAFPMPTEASSNPTVSAEPSPNRGGLRLASVEAGDGAATGSAERVGGEGLSLAPNPKSTAPGPSPKEAGRMGPRGAAAGPTESANAGDSPTDQPPSPPAGGRPSLKRVK
jgi:stringent starvation protein B